MKEMAEEYGYDLSASFAYSDSETDAPMLEVVGHPFAVNPDKTLRRLAEENGWPILTFTSPVSMRARLGLDTTVAKLAAAGVVTAAVGAITLALVTRRRRPGGRSLTLGA
jgi:hypothetical protein